MAPQYLGDGVYVSEKHGSLWLAVNDMTNEVLCLEPEVMDRLIIYYAKTKKKYLEDDE
jgi:hypothetical protein